MKETIIDSPEEKKLREELLKKTDPQSLRLTRFLNMPDLSRTESSPICEIVKRILSLPDFADFDVLRAPEIVPARESFDLFNFPPDHPARKGSDTYFLNPDFILRTHTTIMWYYHMGLESVREKMKKGEPVGALSYGKVYRKDEIDRNHMNVFHQMDGWYLCRRENKEIGVKELQDILIKIARTIYGPDINYRFNKDSFPYTDPSLEMEIEVRGRWVEVLGSGVVHSKVLDNLGIDSRVWNGWAFGFGLERLAILSMNLPDIRLLWSGDERVVKQLRLGNSYKEVSRHPPITRDISFVVDSDFVPNNYFDLIRDIGGELVEEVSLLDKYENPEKFGPNKTSYTYRIIYRSNDRTLTTEEIEPLQSKVVADTEKQFGASIR